MVSGGDDTMIHFPDTTLTRYSLTNVPCGGVYGETIQQYVQVGNIRCDFQQEHNTEYAQEYGVELGDLYKIYVDGSVELLDSDILVDPSGTEYDIIGGIQSYPKFHKYLRVHLQRRRTHAIEVEDENQSTG
jgi:hypothetical protein